MAAVVEGVSANARRASLATVVADMHCGGCGGARAAQVIQIVGRVKRKLSGEDPVPAERVPLIGRAAGAGNTALTLSLLVGGANVNAVCPVSAVPHAA